jgi:hypothetical protein
MLSFNKIARTHRPKNVSFDEMSINGFSNRSYLPGRRGQEKAQASRTYLKGISLDSLKRARGLW